MNDISQQIAAQCTTIFGVHITIDEEWPCYVVKTTTTHRIIVHRMIMNWRVSRVPLGHPLNGPDRNWDYFGTGSGALLRAIAGAADWDGADDTSPVGWDRNASTGEYANKGNDRVR